MLPLSLITIFSKDVFSPDLQDTTVLLDLRVTTLEENIGNNSVADLEMRLDAIEGTATDHETRIS